VSGESRVVSFTGVVESVEKELIPRLYIGRIVSDDGKYVVEMDLHSELIVFKPGTRVEVTLTRDIPSYKDGVDLVARGTIVSIKSENEYTSYLISIGGLLFILKSKDSLNLSPTEKVYIKISEI